MRTRKELLFHPHLRNNAPGDKHVRKAISEGLAGHEERLQPVSDDKRPVIEPTRYGFRSFDRQWIIPDARLINQPNPTLWNAHSRDAGLSDCAGRSHRQPRGHRSHSPALFLTCITTTGAADAFIRSGATARRRSPTSSLRFSGTSRKSTAWQSRPRTSWPTSRPSWRIPPSPRGSRPISSGRACAFL